MGNICSDECQREVFNMYNGFERIPEPVVLAKNTPVKQTNNEVKHRLMESSDSNDVGLRNEEYLP